MRNFILHWRNIFHLLFHFSAMHHISKMTCKLFYNFLMMFIKLLCFSIPFTAINKQFCSDLFCFYLSFSTFLFCWTTQFNTVIEIIIELYLYDNISTWCYESIFFFNFIGEEVRCIGCERFENVYVDKMRYDKSWDLDENSPI